MTPTNKSFPPREMVEEKLKAFAIGWFPMTFHERDRGAFVSAGMQIYFWLLAEHQSLLREARAEAFEGR